MTSSLRECSLEETLKKARAVAPLLGITRVTDTTWLDRVGIPVYASIRPGAQRGSLCVNAGKGLRPDEARAGAYMEAIEFAAAEFSPDKWDITCLTPAQITAQDGALFEFIELCPILGRTMDKDDRLPCVEARDLAAGKPVSIPAELVFSPFSWPTGPRMFGSSTNGLSSGNTLLEATVHGVAELLERDVHAFHLIRDTSLPVRTDSLTGHPAELVRRAEDAGLDVALRTTPNPFGLPYFHAYLLEPEDTAPVAISFGAGLHVNQEIAAVRALSEAAQSRLSHIHGGRDDIIDRHDYFDAAARDAELRATAELRRRVRDPAGMVPMSALPDFSHEVDTLTDALDLLLDRARAVGVRQVLTVDLTPVPDAGLHVVRVVAPRLESFQPSLQRVGRRLAAHGATPEIAVAP
ncbi:YcaO-like family protein [Streptomyces sp. SID9727]|uniref:YcaO-like family protein n=1 Tax=Streptomyces sp. SID9727 TaxID=2706114 RepID=UPI0013CB1E7A|nr:YcaO-like family protein [Streptomyces sp. SID9727]NEC66053.1 hypothetical protein [Streptomyces sp. SID9727]